MPAVRTRQAIFSLECAHSLWHGHGMNKTTRLFIRVTNEQKARLQAACDRDGAVMSEICRKALERFVIRSERKAQDKAQ